VGPRATDGPDVPYGGGLTTEVLSHSSRASHSDLAHARDEGVLKQGFLFPIQTSWASWTNQRKRKWYRLHNGNLYFIASAENLDPQFCCDIRTCTVNIPPASSKGDDLPYCFVVLEATGKNLKFQAENEDELFKWISAIRRCQSKWRLSSRAGLGPGAEVADKANASVLERMLEANPLCAECGAGEVEWVSTSLGVTLCPDCAIGHRKLGSNISRLRSIYMDLWCQELVACIADSMGNEQANAIWETSVPQGWTKPTDKSSAQLKEQWVTAKYKWFGFVDEARVTKEETSDQLGEAAGLGDTAQVMWCLAHKADINAASNSTTDKSMKSALHRACEGGHVNTVLVLMQNGADLLQRDFNGRTPLDLTSQTRPANYEVLEKLLTMKEQGELL